MADLDETFRRVIEAAQRSYAASERLWRDVLAEAHRRLATDPLLAAQATAAVRLLEAETARSLADPAERDALRHGARLGAALALVIAERPELITGEPPTGAPPVEVIATRIAPLFDRYQQLSAVRDAASAVLTALALQGYEVTRRADRFASLRDDGRRLRIPLRGTCGICWRPVSRKVDGTTVELLIGPWEHAAGDPDDGGHRPGLVDAP